MKNFIILGLSAALFMAACKTNNKAVESTAGKSAQHAKDDSTTALKAPFIVTLTNPQQLATDSLQSFVLAEVDGYWLIFGGRTVGFHGTGGAGRTFPARYANKQFIVYNPTSKIRYAAPLPAQYQRQLSSTNMQAYQDGNTLWVAGGYGCNDNSSQAPCYQTYPQLTAIALSGLVSSIVKGQTSNLEKYIVSLQDPRFQVSGGALRKIGSNFYLVMGHNYDTIYVDGVTGIYTEQIRRFNAAVNQGAITITNYQAWQNPEFHRRDLVVVESMAPPFRGVQIGVFGGVFQPNAQFGLPWTHPVFIFEDAAGKTAYYIEENFNQQFNAYDCANIVMYDDVRNVLYTTLIGGITSSKLDEYGKVKPADTFLPWSRYVSTIARYANGPMQEMPQASPLLPGFVGGSAEVILKSDVARTKGTQKIIDYSKLKPGDNLVGWMYGGIISTAEQTNAVSNPSFASATIYEIHIRK